MSDRLEFEAKFKDGASAGVRKLGKTLEAVRPSHGMAAASKWMDTFHKGADRTVGALRPVSGMLNSVGVGGLAASLSIGEMVKQFRDLADSTLTLKELGRQSRISATDIARLQYAAGKLHVDPAAMSGAIGSWSSKMVEFKMHTSQFYRDLMRQNADVAAKIESDSPIDGLKRAMDFISRIKDPQIQKRWADDAGLGDILPMLGKGPDGVAAAIADAGREVKPITQEMQAAADRFNEATNRFNQTWANFKNDLGPSILDPLSHTLDKLDEGMKWAAQYPGDAAAAAATIAGSFAGLYARARLMRGSKLAGGTEMGAAAGEMTGAAREQAKAGGSLIEAAVALKEAAAELRGAGGGPGSPTKEVEQDGESLASKVKGALPVLAIGGTLASVFGGITWAMLNRDKSKSLVDGGRPDVQPWDNNLGLPGTGDDAPSASAKWKVPSRYEAEVRARRAGLTYDAPNTDGNALHRNDEMPAAVTAQELFAKVREGSKDGIVAGLREMAQQQELNGGGGVNADGGTPNMRRGKGAIGKWRSTPGTEGGAPLGKGAVGGSFKGGHGAQAALAKESYDFYRAKGLDHNAALSMVAQEEGESGFNFHQKSGDSGLAHGAYSWHPDRRAAILAQTGINIDSATHQQQLEAAWHEGTKGSRAGFFQSLNGRSLQDAVYQGVHRFEGSRYQIKDTAARLGMARRWDGGGSFLAPKPVPSTPGGGTPAPSTSAQTAADAFKAHQRALNGTPPQAHATGGHIRGPGTGKSDSIPALLSNGEYVVQASAAGQFLPLLHAINGGHLSAFASGGPVGKPLTVHRAPSAPPVGFGVDERFYPKFTPGISAEEGRANRRNWRDFFRRPTKDGGMGASWRTTLGTMAMLAGESGYGLNAKTYGWDANGPSGGVEQWHDVTKGKWAGRIHRLSDLMTFAMLQHADWHDPLVQQAFKRREDTTSFAAPWRKMLAAKTARGALKEGIDHVEIPAHKDLELMRRAPNIIKLQHEAMADGAMRRGEADPVEVNIRHHPHTGRPIVTAKAGRGVKLGIRTAPTMRPS